MRYLAFCQPGNPFYDRNLPDPEALDRQEFAPGFNPEGWKRELDTEWIYMRPPEGRMPAQGWKIHVSATLDNAERILSVVLDYCVPRMVNFKFIRDRSVLTRRNSKYGDRSASGKFVTIYPKDEAQLETILNELGELLDGEQGPYILSDLRWREGPLYVRYGGFVARMVRAESGELVHCIEDPDGNLVPDRRGPGFRPPEWVKLPECLSEAWAARQAGTLRDFPYRVKAAMHFSNGGGVYIAQDTRTGREVLLKEARPLAGIDELNRDAVDRQNTERWALEKLAGLDVVPELLEQRIGREHYFLARGFVDGTPLQRLVNIRNPYLLGNLDSDKLAEYTEWALRVLDRIEEGVRQMHERGVVYADLHPNNVLVDEQDRVRFIDMETASPVEERAGQAIGAPGFRAPLHYRGTEVDWYAMGCLRIAMFMPMTVLMPADPRKLEQLLELVTSTFPVPDNFADQVRQDLGPSPYGTEPLPNQGPAGELWPEPTPQQWPQNRKLLIDHILGSATPERQDRLYPGDIGQFVLPAGPLSLAYGVAGVMTALSDLGVEVPTEHLSWLTDAVARLEHPAPGLFDGLTGIAYGLDRIGQVEQGHEVLGKVRAISTDLADDTLMSGLAGMVAGYAHFADRYQDQELADACLNLVDQLRARPLPEDKKADTGLYRGATGRAFAYLRAYHLCKDRDLLEAAAEAIRHDLTRLDWEPESTAPLYELRTQARWLLPVLQSSGTGIALVIEQLLRHYEAPDLAAARDLVAEVLKQEYITLSGLLQGRSGVMLTLHTLGMPADDPVMRRHLKALSWMVLPHGDGIGFLGDGVLRLSCDLGTGAAGVLAVVDRIVSGQTGPLPLHLFGAEPAEADRNTNGVVAQAGAAG
jgi:serine/threonine protein kinase